MGRTDAVRRTGKDRTDQDLESLSSPRDSAPLQKPALADPIAVTQPPQPAAASVLKPNFGIVFVFLFTVSFFCFPLFVTEGTVTK